ncbi:type III restriction enzyme [Nitzschia inconspicua]|uniref:Type III restriction enzyme n=1 Tax=Nitzschia inconspicua TaxID=303405 RepID=A0A9K3PAV9_9STRA|nr:type III restriction enzyme [Nitzschia inconspicua]
MAKNNSTHQQVHPKPKTVKQQASSRPSCSASNQGTVSSSTTTAAKGVYTQIPSTNVGPYGYGLDTNNLSVASFMAASNNGYYNHTQGQNTAYPHAGNYANSAFQQGYWPSGIGGYWASPQQTSSSKLYTTPTKKVTTNASSKVSAKKPLVSANASKDTSVFDENSELKERIRELETQLALENTLMAAKDTKKEFKENRVTGNVKPDNCASVTPVKAIPSSLGTPSKMDTPIKDLNKFDRKWIQRYEELIAYQKSHGHNMVPSACMPLGPWVCRQRHEKKKGSLSKERIELLDAIDFVWVAK